MAISNHERVGKALDLVKDGLLPFVERELRQQYQDQWFAQAKQVLSDQQEKFAGSAAPPKFDVAAVLTILSNFWTAVFKKTLGQAERSLVGELRDVRNKWAHQNPFSSDDAYRALDSAHRLLLAVSATQADELDKMKGELLRVRFDEQARSDKRKTAGVAVEGPAVGTLKPWREVVTPHKDVASGRYQQAEFAADLWQVHIGEGSDEYKQPAEFFRRTYLTESLKRLLTGAVQRVSAGQGDPVVQLQTNFGGGKTHSMLALYHMFSGVPPGELTGVDSVMAAAGVTTLPNVRRVVLVGNKISPGNPSKRPDGTVVRTLWGELAWQLGGKAAFERVRADDELATSPGDVLRELLREHGPCLVLIDEWVAYARQLHDQKDLPGGDFETHFTFAQALTESAKLAGNCLLVISLPASETGGSPHTLTTDVEVGGERGRAALDRLRNAIGRVEASWRPASAEEGFEIVRRRLFEPIVEKEQFVARDRVAREFYDLYRTQHQEFPPECRNPDYETRIKAAYPIHPEIFDRLYSDWSTLVKFQRTRGVLRLMAAVIHSLWERGDRNPLILPANIPIDDPRVQFELTRYLADGWVPIIATDVDGPSALPLRIDAEVPNLGKFAACRRVARTIYLGSAPIEAAANRGLEDRRIKLGCVMPGESPNIFGDALRRLSAAATYLYQDGARYWYSTQPTVTKMADDRAEQLKRNADAVYRETERRVRLDLKKHGDFAGVHPMPATSQDVPDEMSARLVVLDTDHPFSKDPGNDAEGAAKSLLENRGSSPRLYRNTLVFLAADKTRLQDLDDAVRRYLAWDSIVSESDTLNLTPQQRKQAEAQRSSADGTVNGRLPETYQWLLVPTQREPADAMSWQAIRLSGQGSLAERASKKLQSEELLIVAFAPTRLRMELERIPLWRGEHVAVKQVQEDFARYVYLPRLKSADVLLDPVRKGPSLLTWVQDGFGYADAYDETADRYRGLRIHQLVDGPVQGGLLVRPERATKQQEADVAAAGATSGVGTPGVGPTGPGTSAKAVEGTGVVTPPATAVRPKRFHGTVKLDATRVGRDAGRIAEEVVAHLTGLVGSKVAVTLEIAAEVPSGAPESVVRTVTENSRTLKFTNFGFEEE